MELFTLGAKLTLDTDDFNRELDKAESTAESFHMPEAESLELDNSDFNENIKESEILGNDFGSSMETVFKGIKTALTVTGVVGAISGIVSNLKEAINMTAETADGIDKGAKRMNMSRKAYQEWDHALQQSGAGISDLRRGLVNLQKVQDATDPKNWKLPEEEMARFGKTTSDVSDDVMDALNELNMMDDITSGKFGSAEAMMEEALYRIADMNDDPNTQGILVRKLFGRGGDALLPMLADGRDAVEDLVSEAGDLGLIMSDDEINNAVAYGDAVANLKAEFQAIQSAFLEDIIPVLKEAVENITKILAVFNPRNKNTKLDDAFNRINAKALESSKKIDETSASAQQLIDRLSGMGDYWTLDEKGQKTWNALAQEFVDNYPEFAQYIDLEKKKINENTGAIKENIRQWALREKQRVIDAAFAEKKEKIAEKEAKALEKEVEAMNKEDEAERRRIEAVSGLNAEIESEVGNLQAKAEEERRQGNLAQASYYESEASRIGDLRLAENAGQADILHSQSVLQANAGSDYAKAQQIGEITKEYNTATREANELRKTADEMNKDVEEAVQGLEADQQQLIKLMDKTTINVDSTKTAVKDLKKELDTLPSSVPITFPLNGPRAMTHAIGSDYIPYDNYPALLHRGEKILTATEARQEGQNIDLSGLEDRIESAIRKGMEGAEVRSYLNGRDITDEVNRNNINAVKGRRFSG